MVNIAAVNTGVRVFAFDYFAYVPWRGTAGSGGTSPFNFGGPPRSVLCRWHHFTFLPPTVLPHPPLRLVFSGSSRDFVCLFVLVFVSRASQKPPRCVRSAAPSRLPRRVPNGEGRRAGRLSCARRLPTSLPRSRVCLGPLPIFYSGCLFFFLFVSVLQEFFVCSGY